MGRTACTEPQCLYKGDLYLYLYFEYVILIARARLQLFLERASIQRYTYIAYLVCYNHIEDGVI